MQNLGAAPGGGRMMKTVLLVEDNDDNAAIYTLILEHHGFRVRRASDGGTAVRLAPALLPDLILMDISLPVLSGWDATRQIKADPRAGGIPVVALTAHCMPEDRARASQVGCDAFLAKPCEPKAVLEVVRRFTEPLQLNPAM
jgi:two-component system, cell cycle response regulator DivK